MTMCWTHQRLAHCDGVDVQSGKLMILHLSRLGCLGVKFGKLYMLDGYKSTRFVLCAPLNTQLLKFVSGDVTRYGQSTICCLSCLATPTL